MAICLAWAALWAIIVTATVLQYLLASGWAIDATLTPALLPYLAGSFIGGVFGHAIAVRFGVGRPPSVRFAAFFAATAIMTLVFTGFFFFLPQRAYFAQWHADAFSIDWMFQILFTGLGSAYLFMATGLRPLLPWAGAALFIASFLFSRGRFPAAR